MFHVKQPRAPRQVGRRILSSLPVGTDKKVLRRPVSAIFRQRGAQFLLPLRDWVSHRPQMAAMCDIPSRVIRMYRADQVPSTFAGPGTMTGRSGPGPEAR